jgi:hypothetical protein
MNAKAAKTAKQNILCAIKGEFLRARTARKKIVCALCVLCVLPWTACGTNLFRQYEYEEDMFLSLDGAATITVSASIPALNALRGTSFDPSPNARTDRDAIRRYFSSPVARVIWVRPSRRNNRRFVHVRLEVGDVRRLNQAPPFAWSTYEFKHDGELDVYKQNVGASAGGSPGTVNWNGSELVAVRLHLPSKVVYQNTPDRRRGNIFVWEQPLTERLKGTPIEIEVRMETQSILYRTLWLFGATFLAVAVAFALIIGWVMKRGGAPPGPPTQPG